MENEIKTALSKQLDKDITSKKEKLIMLKKYAKQAQSPAKKINYFKSIENAESTLRKMRLTISPAKEAGEQAIIHHDVSFFDQFGMFLETHQYIQDEIKKIELKEFVSSKEP